MVDAAGALTAAAAAARGVVTVTVNGVRAAAEVEVAAAGPIAIEDFERGGDWKLRVSPAGTPGSVSVAEGAARSGRRALRLEYDFGAGGGARAVYALCGRELPPARALRVWVYGDGQGAWLRARLRDGAGGSHTLDLARRVEWAGSWRELRAALPGGAPGPVLLESIYVVEPDPALRPRGVLLLDDLAWEP